MGLDEATYDQKKFKRILVGRSPRGNIKFGGQEEKKDPPQRLEKSSQRGWKEACRGVMLSRSRSAVSGVAGK